MTRRRDDGSPPGCGMARVRVQANIWQLCADLERIVAEAGPGRMEVPGAMGDWTLKDVLAHLATWRRWSVARLEGAVHGKLPTPSWTGDLDEEQPGDVAQINQQFYEAARDRPLTGVLRDSRETLDRLEAILPSIPEEDLLAPDRFPALGGHPAATWAGSPHFYEDHLPEIEAFLARIARRRPARGELATWAA